MPQYSSEYKRRKDILMEEIATSMDKIVTSIAISMKKIIEFMDEPQNLALLAEYFAELELPSHFEVILEDFLEKLMEAQTTDSSTNDSSLDDAFTQMEIETTIGKEVKGLSSGEVKNKTTQDYLRKEDPQENRQADAIQNLVMTTLKLAEELEQILIEQERDEIEEPVSMNSIIEETLIASNWNPDKAKQMLKERSVTYDDLHGWAQRTLNRRTHPDKGFDKWLALAHKRFNILRREKTNTVEHVKQPTKPAKRTEMRKRVEEITLIRCAMCGGVH
eukprot:TRINITY_DN2803_c0_g1_i1.p1 TRINITY_DN2803_c0_g1~~TRINITY_DN2803_c0_g1_i1.p1  ORF type:complete len:276 (-),score=48.38 TRINITY_DN2803_c0_g1_i1:650-1477(-)